MEEEGGGKAGLSFLRQSSKTKLQVWPKTVKIKKTTFTPFICFAPPFNLTKEIKFEHSISRRKVKLLTLITSCADNFLPTISLR